MYKKKYVSAIILCAGKSTRFSSDINQNKIMYEINNKPLFMYTYETFCKVKYIDEIIIVQSESLEKYSLNNYTKFVYGDASRALSSYNGIRQSSCDIVVIHDGARANISVSLIEKTIEQCFLNKCVCTGVNVVDTVKLVDQDKYVVSTLNRKNVYLIQTPQAFYRDILIDSYSNVSDFTKYTDEASIVEDNGYKVKIIDGDPDNIKVTFYEDLKKLNVSKK